MDPDKNQTLMDAIQELRHKEPFDPFRIVTTSGDKYLVENPDNMAIGESLISYFFPRSDKFIFIRINQLVAVEQFQHNGKQ
jgi:hypothetical protein